MGISLGLVGLGSFGSAFADLFMAHPLVDRVGLCDREGERIDAFAKKDSWRGKFHPRDAYASLEEICRSDLDALVIITQHWLHAPQCVQALQAGKSVYSAVPVIAVPDHQEALDWCDRLVQAVRRSGRHYMLGETTYYHPESMYCRRRAAEGAFGQFVYAEGEYLHDVDCACNLREVFASRTASAAGREYLAVLADCRRRGVRGGPMEYPTHSTSGPICVMNTHAVRASCRGMLAPADDPYFPDTCHHFANETATYEMSNGATMRICEYRKVGHPGREGFRIYGTEGSYENGAWLTRKDRTPLTVEQMRAPLPEAVVEAFRGVAGDGYLGGHNGSHAYLVHEFVDAIAHDRRPAVDVFQAVRYTAAGAAAHASALADGQWVSVPDWGDC